MFFDKIIKKYNHLLIVFPSVPEVNPTWGRVKEAITGISLNSSIVLFNTKSNHIRADGSANDFTIVFYEYAKATPKIVGRRVTSCDRGINIFSGNRVIVTVWERWSLEDGIKVFESFYNFIPLQNEFTLRDPTKEYSDEDIRRLLFADTLLPDI